MKHCQDNWTLHKKTFALQMETDFCCNGLIVTMRELYAVRCTNISTNLFLQLPDEDSRCDLQKHKDNQQASILRNH